MRISGIRTHPDFPADPSNLYVLFDGKEVPGHTVITADEEASELICASLSSEGFVRFDGAGDLITERRIGRVEIRRHEPNRQ